MANSEAPVPNERLRRARSLKSWSQAQLAEHVGTSFEMVSRWERGVTIPSPYYRERLSAMLEKTAEELGLVRHKDSLTLPSAPFVFLASSHVDAEKPIVSHLKLALETHGIALWSSRQLGRQESESLRSALQEVVQAAQGIVILLSPEARSSRHVRDALAMARKYQRPVCGVWIEGEFWQECLPQEGIELVTALDARTREVSDTLPEIIATLEPVKVTSSTTDNSTFLPPPTHHTPFQHAGRSRVKVGLLIGLMVLVIAASILGSFGVFTHFGVLSARSSAAAPAPVRGGTWIDDYFYDLASLIPQSPLSQPWSNMAEQALYLPLFYGDSQGVIHPGAATEIPTMQNGDISADATIWTFHLRPHLVWSDGQPYDARDVDYTWRLELNPKFYGNVPGLNLISSTTLSADRLSITFHLKQPYAPFLSIWVDGSSGPLPAHHFSSMTPEAIAKSPENWNPQVTSGPFMMGESVPGDHYTLVRNPRYYRASEGLPHLDRLVIHIASSIDAVLSDLQAGSVDSYLIPHLNRVQDFQHFKQYTLVAAPTSSYFMAFLFNFHNLILATHLEVRTAIALAIDHQALITKDLHGFGQLLCTDHASAFHPGYQPDAGCPPFDPVAANKLLDDNGWLKGQDGVRMKGTQRLEFELSTNDNEPLRIENEAMLQQNLSVIGIKLDIQNYGADTFFTSFLGGGKASPPTGAIAGRYDIAIAADGPGGYDPDNSWMLACDQIPPQGGGNNISFYCNPALDALFNQELAATDAGVRQYIFNQIHHIYVTDFPFIPLYSMLNVGIVRKGTHNYQLSPFGGDDLNVWEWWCDQGKC